LRGGSAPAEPTARGGVGTPADPAKEEEAGGRVRAPWSKEGGVERAPADHAARREAEKGVAGEAETRGEKGGQDGKRGLRLGKPDECDTKGRGGDVGIDGRRSVIGHSEKNCEDERRG
jgi:hypothetical protein